VPATPPSCKPAAIDFTKTKEKAFCITQLARKNATDPKSVALITPGSIGDFITVADAACIRLGFGSADPGSIKWAAAAAVKCYNGKEVVTGPAFAALSCCPPGSSLANWRETRATLGRGFWDIKATDTFARQRDSEAESGIPRGALIPEP